MSRCLSSAARAGMARGGRNAHKTPGYRAAHQAATRDRWHETQDAKAELRFTTSIPMTDEQRALHDKHAELWDASERARRRWAGFLDAVQPSWSRRYEMHQYYKSLLAAAQSLATADAASELEARIAMMETESLFWPRVESHIFEYLAKQATATTSVA